MKIDFVDFVLWLDYRYDKRTNREIINYLYQKILRKLNSLELKITNENLKNEFIAFVFNNSSISKNNNNQYFNEESEEKDYYDIHYLDEIRNLFIDIKEYCEEYRFNILDTKDLSLELNFTDFVFQNIGILLPEEQDDEDNSEDNDCEY